jgi:hypothetical protein
MKIRPILVAAVIAVAAALASCSSGPSQSNNTGYDDAGCKIGCDKCPSQTLCVGTPYVPVCLVQCVTTADCDTGICAVLLNPGGVRVCIGGSALVECRPVDCMNPPQCLNETTQLKPLPNSLSACGWEPIHCDSGCDSATGSCK